MGLRWIAFRCRTQQEWILWNCACFWRHKQWQHYDGLFYRFRCYVVEWNVSGSTIDILSELKRIYNGFEYGFRVMKEKKTCEKRDTNYKTSYSKKKVDKKRKNTQKTLTRQKHSMRKNIFLLTSSHSYELNESQLRDHKHQTKEMNTKIAKFTSQAKKRFMRNDGNFCVKTKQSKSKHRQNIVGIYWKEAA